MKRLYSGWLMSAAPHETWLFRTREGSLHLKVPSLGIEVSFKTPLDK